MVQEAQNANYLCAEFPLGAVGLLGILELLALLLLTGRPLGLLLFKLGLLLGLGIGFQCCYGLQRQGLAQERSQNILEH